MGIGYQFVDRKAFDYELWYHDRLRMPVRGPRTVFENTPKYWSFCGAAQTFGRFVEKPFPLLVSSWNGLPHMNLGFAGAGPELFLRSEGLLAVVNSSERCFLQIMSGRSVSTSLLRARGFGGMLEFLEGPLKGRKFLAAEAYRQLLKIYGRNAADDQIAEARRNWEAAYRQLIGAVRVPVVCIWIDHRQAEAGGPSGGPSGGSDDLLGAFPHLISEVELSVFAQLGVPLVRTVAEHPTLQLLLDFTSKAPVDVFNSSDFAARPEWSRRFNTYYSPPEVHERIALDIHDFINRQDEPGAPIASAAPTGGRPDRSETRAASGRSRILFQRLAGRVRHLTRAGAGSDL